MKRLALIIGILLFCNTYKVNANSNNYKNIHVIYSDFAVDKDEEFMITLNFESVELYYSIQVILELGEYFEIVGNTPCKLLLNSYYSEDEVYVNSIENNVIRFVAFKKTTDNLASFNNIVQITLKSKINCQDVRKYLQNIKIGLFDAQYQTIPVNLITSEGIKVEWLMDVYELELGNDLPNFSDDIVISNRNNDEYIVKVLTDKININKVGPQVVTAYVYDFTNSSCVILTKAINILDLEKPVITGLKEVVINDVDLTIDKLINYSIKDNYDVNPIINITYMSSNGELFKTKKDFLEYLQKNTIGIIKLIAIDSSKNKSDEFIQTIKINDTIAPTILVNESIEIKDVEIEKFKISEYLNITDNYDQNPVVTYLIEGIENSNIVDELIKHYEINVLVYAIDNFLNKSNEHNISIKLIDTTPPKLEKTADLIVNDYEFTEIESMLENIIKTSDNFTLPLEIKYEYFQDEIIITKDEFNKLLYQGVKLKVKVKALDQFNNESNTIIIETKIKDTTPPNITINNVEESKKYLSIPSVDFNVVDNFQNDVIVEVFLDGENYQNTPINIIGKHSLVIMAKDASGNETSKTVNFEIIKNNLIGCGLDANCYSENYQTVLYIAFSILVVSVLIFMVKLIIKKNKTKIN